MRRVYRRNLSTRTVQKLKDEQDRVDRHRAAGMLVVEMAWKRARKNRPLQEAFSMLRMMAGNRERCMYCSDSRGTELPARCSIRPTACLRRRCPRSTPAHSHHPRANSKYHLSARMSTTG